MTDDALRALRDAVETLAGVVERLADAMLREGTERDGNWGFPSYYAEVEWAKQTAAHIQAAIAQQGARKGGEA